MKESTVDLIAGITIILSILAALILVPATCIFTARYAWEAAAPTEAP